MGRAVIAVVTAVAALALLTTVVLLATRLPSPFAPSPLAPSAAGSVAPTGPCFASAPAARALLGSADLRLSCHMRPGPVQQQCCCYNATTWPIPLRVAAARAVSANQADSIARKAAAVLPAPDDASVALRCLPSFVVVGAQKAGTTALMGYTLFHPAFAPPRLKEAHFFDKGFQSVSVEETRLSALGPPETHLVHRYVGIFPPLPVTPTTDTNSRSPHAAAFPPSTPATAGQLTGEATPSYILSAVYLRRLRTLLPDARLVLLLRDPVDRAWSEYQMKRRRIEGQLQLSEPYTRRLAVEILTHCRRLSDDRNKVIRCLLEDHRRTDEEHILRCLGRRVLKYERVEPLETIAAHEMSDADACMYRTTNEECIHSPEHTQSLALNWQKCWDKGSNSNIIRHFVVRGLYLEQIKAAHGIFPREQLLILADTDLKLEPVQTMARVFEHVGLPPFDVSGITTDAIEARRREIWEKFDTTGWQMQGDYVPMPLELRERLVQFFTPHNARLYDYLGRDFGWARSTAT